MLSDATLGWKGGKDQPLGLLVTWTLRWPLGGANRLLEKDSLGLGAAQDSGDVRLLRTEIEMGGRAGRTVL